MNWFNRTKEAMAKFPYHVDNAQVSLSSENGVILTYLTTLNKVGTLVDRKNDLIASFAFISDTIGVLTLVNGAIATFDLEKRVIGDYSFAEFCGGEEVNDTSLPASVIIAAILDSYADSINVSNESEVPNRLEVLDNLEAL